MSRSTNLPSLLLFTRSFTTSPPIGRIAKWVQVPADVEQAWGRITLMMMMKVRMSTSQAIAADDVRQQPVSK